MIIDFVVGVGIFSLGVIVGMLHMFFNTKGDR